MCRICFREEKELTFVLETDKYYIRGGNHDTSQLIDKTWVGIKKKSDNTYKVYYLDIDYNGSITKELENAIIDLL